MSAFGIICVIVVIAALLAAPPKKRRGGARRQTAVKPVTVARLSASSSPIGAGGDDFNSRIERQFGDSIDKGFFHSVAGVSFSNDDGVSRQSLVLKCKHFDRIGLVREPNNPHGSTAVAVVNAAGQKLGYLHHANSLEIAPQIDAHREWFGVVSQVFEGLAGDPAALIVYLMRVKREPVIDLFEEGLKKRLGNRYDLRFRAELQKAHGANADGSDRQKLIAGCNEFDLLGLEQLPPDKEALNAIWVTNVAGQRLGALEPRAASEIRPQMDAGRIWGAMVREKKTTPGGRSINLVLCVYRIKV